MSMNQSASGESQQNLAENLIGKLITSGTELGVQLAIIQRGKVIVDLAMGQCLMESEQPVTRDALFPAFSIGKGVASTVIHLLVERGLLDYDKPIAHYWPEFGANGKAEITLRHVMSHTAGLPQMPQVDAATMADWDRMCAEIAALSPLWEPGTRRQYHAITFGWLIGEPASRVDGRPFESIVREEITKPLGMDDFYFGVPEIASNRIVHLPEPKTSVYPTPAADDLAQGRSIPPEVWPLEFFINRPEIQRACIPASNAFSNALSVAWHYAGLDFSNKNQRTVLSKSSLQTAITPNPPSGPLPAGHGFGLGYALKGPPENPSAIFGHDGYGGSIGCLHVDEGIAVGLLRNNTLNPPTELHEALNQIISTIKTR